MTIVRNIHLNLEMRQVLRREGIRQRSSIMPEIKALIDELRLIINDEHLLEPAVVYETYPVCVISQNQLSLADNVVLHGTLLTSSLSGAEEIVAVVCTIGHKVEKRVTDYLRGSEPLRGLLLDGIANAAVDSLTHETCKLIKSVASVRDYQVSSPCSPGMPGFPITEQWPLFQLVPAEEIGVSLTASGIMVPLKSASMVFGLGQQVKTWEQTEVCARCNLSETCRYRLAG